MLMLPGHVKVFIATKAVDMRKSFDGLTLLVQEVLEKDPLSGHLFVFTSRQGDKVKILYWDRNGFCIWYKRLERGVFRMPRSGEKSCCISTNELYLLLEGIDLNDPTRHRSLIFEKAC